MIKWDYGYPPETNSKKPLKFQWLEDEMSFWDFAYFQGLC